VVAAPEIPEAVQKVLEYLNGQGLRLYGIEFSYFKADGPALAECFVPRVVVAPRAADPARVPERTPLGLETFLERLPVGFASGVEAFLSQVSDAGAMIEWKAYGASVIVVRDQKRQVGALDETRFWITLQSSGGFPQEPFDAAAAALESLGIGSRSKDGWYRSVSWAKTTPGDAQPALAVMVELADALTPARHWVGLDPSLTVQFERNDNNIWVKGLPALADYVGHHLRGEMQRPEGSSSSSVTLFPLKGEMPGWRPVLADDAAALWPPNAHSGVYILTIREQDANP
jgi:hypothetical protein